MTATTHSEMVKILSKPGEEILKQLTPEKVAAWHMITGISGEAGELTDAVKKNVIYNKTLDLKNVIEELGDLEFYLEGLRQVLYISREETLQYNQSKLAERYKNYVYTDEAAQKRADKIQEGAN